MFFVTDPEHLRLRELAERNATSRRHSVSSVSSCSQSLDESVGALKSCLNWSVHTGGPSKSLSRESPPSQTLRFAGFPTQQSKGRTMTRLKDVKCWYFLYGNCKFGSRCMNSHAVYDRSNGPDPRNEERCARLSIARRASLAHSHISSSTDSSYLFDTAIQHTALPRTRPLQSPTFNSHWVTADIELSKMRSGSVAVITIDEALLLHIDDDNRMLAFLGKDLRRFVTGSGDNTW